LQWLEDTSDRDAEDWLPLATIQAFGIEAALWPHLYVTPEMCATYGYVANKQDDGRRSGKRLFQRLVMSEVLDFCTDFDLLQFQFDQMVFNQIAGKKNVASGIGNTLRNMLSTSTFGPKFWQCKTDCVVDMIRIYGVAALWFATISPYEWTFPWSECVKRARDNAGKGVTGLAGLEVVHVVHVLEQVVRRWLFGGAFTSVGGVLPELLFRNVPCFVYRFEYQEGKRGRRGQLGRGSVHVHILFVCLDGPSVGLHHVVRADIPKRDPELGYYAQWV